MPPARRSSIFISYSHRDRRWKEKLLTHLHVVEGGGSLEIWNDTRIGAGEDWRKEIERAIQAATVAILLVSADFLSSEFIRREEVPRLLRRRNREGLNVFPVILKPCNWRQVEWLARMLVRPEDGRPLSEIRRADHALANIAEEILSITSIDKKGNRRRGASRNVVIGVDVGSNKIAGGAFDLGASEWEFAKHPPYEQRVQQPAKVSTVLNQVEQVVDLVIREEGLARHRIRGIGVAAPGQVDMATGTLLFGPGLGVGGVHLKNDLQDRFQIEVRVDNDARCATRCELHFGIGRSFRNFAGVFIGNGVGGGLVIDGHIYYGDRFCAGELGHSSLNPKGLPCKCGRHGCLETYVNGPAIVRKARKIARQWEAEGRKTLLSASGDELDTRGVAAALDSGDEAARIAIREVAELLGQGLANVINIVDVAHVVLGGGVTKGFYRHMIDDVRKVVQGRCLTRLSNSTISPARYVTEGAGIGSALLFHAEEPWEFQR